MESLPSIPGIADGSFTPDLFFHTILKIKRTANITPKVMCMLLTVIRGVPFGKKSIVCPIIHKLNISPALNQWYQMVFES